MASDNIYSTSTMLQIFVKTLRGKTLTLDLNSRRDTISDIKNKIFQLEGIKPELQMLTYCGKKLDTNHSIKQSKLSAFCTIDLSLKLLSSQTVILLKLPQNDQEDITIPFTPFTTLYDIKQYLQSISHKHQIPNIKYFVHNNNILRDSALRIAQMDELYNDLTLHTKFGEPFIEALYTEYNLLHNGKRVISSKTNTIMDMKISEGMITFLRDTNINPLFYSGYCPYKHVSIMYNNTQLKLRMMDSSEYAQPFGAPDPSLQKCRTEEFGLLPHMILNVAAKYLPMCDCCEPNAINGASFDTDVISVDINTDSRNFDENTIVINVEIPDESFILHNKWYYINGIFYKKPDFKRKHQIDLQLYPILKAPYELHEDLLICGYIRNVSQMYKRQIPTDVINVIVMLYPILYGGRYDIEKHNHDLKNKLQQKTDIFMIDNICFYLKFGAQNENENEEYVYSDGSYYLVLDFSKEKSITVVVILCTVHCRISQQSYTCIRNIDVDDAYEQDGKYYISLPDFDITSSLSSLICDIQIINMLKCSRVYEYPVLLRQSAYLLEWQIDEELMHTFKVCVAKDERQSFESGIFYNLFKLRCYPNEKKQLLLAIQLIALPTNRPNKEDTLGLSTKCKIFETETSTKIPQFPAVFDYTEDNSAFATILMKSQKFEEKKILRFRVEIIIVDPDNAEIGQHNDIISVQNLHSGNRSRGLKSQKDNRRRRRYVRR